MRLDVAGLRGESLRMLVLTGVSFALGYALTVIGTEWIGLDPRIAYAISICLCTVVNFFGCRYFVFRGPHASLLQAALRFFAAVLALRLCEVALFSLLTMFGTDYRIAYVVTSGISFVAKFFIAKFFVFGPKRT